MAILPPRPATGAGTGRTGAGGAGGAGVLLRGPCTGAGRARNRSLQCAAQAPGRAPRADGRRPGGFDFGVPGGASNEPPRAPTGAALETRMRTSRGDARAAGQIYAAPFTPPCGAVRRRFWKPDAVARRETVGCAYWPAWPSTTGGCRPSPGPSAMQRRRRARGPGGVGAHAYHIWNNRGQFAGRDGMLAADQKRGIFSRLVDAVADARLLRIRERSSC